MTRSVLETWVRPEHGQGDEAGHEHRARPDHEVAERDGKVETAPESVGDDLVIDAVRQFLPPGEKQLSPGESGGPTPAVVPMRSGGTDAGERSERVEEGSSATASWGE
jgi:hypothetical protein